MPRKTLKQKKLALERRKNISYVSQAQDPQNELVKREFTLEDLEPAKTENKTKKAVKSPPYTYTASNLHDLVKTLIFALIILSLEFVIYSLWFKN